MQLSFNFLKMAFHFCKNLCDCENKNKMEDRIQGFRQLEASFFLSKGHYDECLAIAKAKGRYGRVGNEARRKHSRPIPI